MRVINVTICEPVDIFALKKIEYLLISDYDAKVHFKLSIYLGIRTLSMNATSPVCLLR